MWLLIEFVYESISFFFIHANIAEGSLKVKRSTIWTNGQAEVGRVRGEKRREEERRSEKRKNRRKTMQVREKVDKSRFMVSFNDLWLRRVKE